MSKDKLKTKDVEDKKVEKKNKKIDKTVVEEETPIKKIGELVLSKLNEYKYLFLLELLVFILLFWLIPKFIFDVKPFVWMILFVVFTVVPTFIFYIRKAFKNWNILLGIPIIYIMIMFILEYCYVNELYGISNLGSLDRTPAWVDAILVTFIIIFFQYIGMLLSKIKIKKRTKK